VSLAIFGFATLQVTGPIMHMFQRVTMMNSNNANQRGRADVASGHMEEAAVTRTYQVTGLNSAKCFQSVTLNNIDFQSLLKDSSLRDH
jgi:hypothetical protein